MLHTTQRRTLTPPAALKFFDGVNDVSTRARLLKEKQESHLAHVGTRLDTRRSKEDTGDVRERALRRLVEQQKALSPRRRAEVPGTGGNESPSPPGSPHGVPGHRHKPGTPSPKHEPNPSPNDGDSDFDPTADPSNLVAVGGVNSHFLSRVSEPVSGEIAPDPFAVLQLHALTTDPRSLGGRKPAEMAGRNKAELRTTDVDAAHRSRALHRKQFNGIERHGRIKDQPLEFVASTNLNLRSPREVPVSAYVTTQLKALRYSMKVGGSYHEEFMRHADSVEEAVIQRKLESRRTAAVDFVETNRQATAGTAEEKLAARQKRAGLVEQRRHVEDAALDAWFDRIRGTDLSSRGATSPKAALSPAKRMLQSLRSPRGGGSDPLAASGADGDAVEEDDVHTLRAKKLITMVALGRIAFTMTESLQAAWLERAAEMRRRQMQIVYCGGMSMKEVHRAWNNVRRQLRVYIQRFKQRKYAEPANLVRRFMVHHRRVSAMTDAVKWYRANVIRCQRQARAYIVMKRARHTLLSLQWAAREAELLKETWPWDMDAAARAETQQRFGGIPGSFTVLDLPLAAAGGSAAGVAPASAERAALLHLIWAAPGGCSVEIRTGVITALVSAAIRDRRRERRRFEHKDRFYQTQLANWKTLHTRGVNTAAPAPPEPPTGMLFLPRAALYGHITRGQSDTANANGGVMPSVSSSRPSGSASGMLSPSVPTGTTPRPSESAEDRPPPLLTPKALDDNAAGASALTPNAAASASFTSSTPTPSAASRASATNKRTPRGARRRRSASVKRVVARSQSRADSDATPGGGGGGDRRSVAGGASSSMPSLKSPALKAVNFSFSHGKPPAAAEDAKSSPGESVAFTPRAAPDDSSVPSPLTTQLLPSSTLTPTGDLVPSSASVRTAPPGETPTSATSTARPATEPAVPAPPARKRPTVRQRTSTGTVVTATKPRSDAFYAKLLGQADVPKMEAFLRHDDRTGDRMRTAYVDQHRIASPVAAKSAEIAKVAEQRTRDASHEPFRSEMIDRMGLRPGDAPPSGPVELQALPITTMAFASATALPTAPAPRVAGSPLGPNNSARRAPPSSQPHQQQFASTARHRPPMPPGSAQQHQQRPRALSPPSAMSVRGRTADVGVRLPAVPASRLAAADPVPASHAHPSRRLLSRSGQRSRAEGPRRSAPATFETDILKAEAGGAVQFLMAAADVHTESHRPRANIAV